jgi:hypothetical protein
MFWIGLTLGLVIGATVAILAIAIITMGKET